tara:strand:+ start:8017 stop:8784 length:768 start_codon:yes stop_codon:yes gene_type:complete
MAGMMVGGAVLGGISGGSEAEAKYAREISMYNDRTIKEAFNSGKQLFGVANVNATKRLQNQINAEQMARNYAQQRIDFQKTSENRRQFMSENQRLTQAATNSMVTSKLGTSSGTAERIREQMKHKGAKNWETEFFNTLDAKKAMETQYRNNLNQIDDSTMQADAYMPGMPPQEPNMTMAIINGAMGGLMGGAQLGSAMGNAFGGGAAGGDPGGGGGGSLPPGGGSQLNGLSGGYGVSGIGSTPLGSSFPTSNMQF